MSASDFKKLAQQTARDEFVAQWPYLFLTGVQALGRPRPLHRTVDFAAVVADPQLLVIAPPPVASPMAIAIRKASPTYPQMITVGRTPNNDIVVTDFQVSKFHAFFKETPEGLMLADAGSRNGTFVGTQQLVNKAKPTLVTPGTKLSFGKLKFTLLDAPKCWDFLRREI